MSEHTPGPWYTSRHEDYTEVWKDYGDERTRIATADDGWIEAAANARLIAAAPDLQSALIDLLAYVEEGYGDTDSEEGRKARAAIAKAMGTND